MPRGGAQSHQQESSWSPAWEDRELGLKTWPPGPTHTALCPVFPLLPQLWSTCALNPFLSKSQGCCGCHGRGPVSQGGARQGRRGQALKKLRYNEAAQIAEPALSMARHEALRKNGGDQTCTEGKGLPGQEKQSKALKVLWICICKTREYRMQDVEL